MQHSSSLPSLEGRCSRLVESALYVARGVPTLQGPAEWLPMRFAHNSDGSISFWSAAQSETFLDADWTQPFTVAPWRPIQSDGRKLFPFSISYLPLPGRPRHQQGSTSESVLRRTLMLAAPSEVLRRRWQSSLARKIGSTQLRPSTTWGELDDGEGVWATEMGIFGASLVIVSLIQPMVRGLWAVLHLVLWPTIAGRNCVGFSQQHCADPGKRCETAGSFEDCDCEDGFSPQVQGLSLDGHGVRFGCCPGHGFAICAGPAAQRLKRYSQIMLMISAPEGKGWGDDDYLFIAGECSDSSRRCLAHDTTIGPSMYTVTEQYIKPVTAAAGDVSWALMKHPQGLPCDVFITHAWSEGIFEFVDKVAFLAYTWNKPITTATALRGNWLAHLLKVKFIYNSVLHASLLLPLRWLTVSLIPLEFLTIGIFGVYLAFKLLTGLASLTNRSNIDDRLGASATDLPGTRPYLQLLGVHGVALICNQVYASSIATGHMFIEGKWVLAVQYFVLGTGGILAMELDRLHSVKTDLAEENLARGFTGKLQDANCSVEADAEQILEQLRESGHEKEVEDAVEVLMTMNVSTPELRTAVQRAGLLLDASHWSRAIVWGTWVTFGGFTPILLYKYGDQAFDPERYAPWFLWLLIGLSALEALIWLVLFFTLPLDRKAFAARVQCCWVVLWPMKVMGNDLHEWTFLVSIFLFCPLVLAISILGPAARHLEGHYINHQPIAEEGTGIAIRFAKHPWPALGCAVSFLRRAGVDGLCLSGMQAPQPWRCQWCHCRTRGVYLHRPGWWQSPQELRRCMARRCALFFASSSFLAP
eukprot:symbB.v1.2.006923.t2/scaffold400.1/size211454/2